MSAEARLREENARLRAALERLAEVYHGTLTGSALHAPRQQTWRECPALTCKAVREALAEPPRPEPDPLTPPPRLCGDFVREIFRRGRS